MRSADKNSLFVLVVSIALLTANGCQRSTVLNLTSPKPSLNSSLNSMILPSGANVLPVTVNGELCGNPSYQYPNQLCTQVTICQPNTTNCQTIKNILVDTGSFGLRIFSSVISVPLQEQKIQNKTLAECVQYGGGNSQWGPIKVADVKLGDEPLVRTLIHTVQSDYASPPGPCTASQSNPDTNPEHAGFNGILGIGNLDEDCGSICERDPVASIYYTCNGAGCSKTVVSSAQQIRNPIVLLPKDNNGVILQLPPVPPEGAASLTGALVLGIGTQSNNSPPQVTTFKVNPDGDYPGEFFTAFGSYSAAKIPAFIDSGSSILFIPPVKSLPDCSSPEGGSFTIAKGIYCPSTTQTFAATLTGADDSSRKEITFQVGNGYRLVGSGNWVFMNLAGLSSDGASAYFDWGLPFFYGKTVYVGIEGTSSPLGAGPYWAY